MDELKEDTPLFDLPRVVWWDAELLSEAGIKTIKDFRDSYHALRYRKITIVGLGALKLEKVKRAIKFHEKWGIASLLPDDESGRQPTEPTPNQIREMCAQIREGWPDSRLDNYRPPAVILEAVRIELDHHKRTHE